MAANEMTMELALLANGLEQLAAGLQALQGHPAPREMKAGILLLDAGMELVIKERLAREHWSLLFENVDKANKADLAAGDFLGVVFERCLARLYGVCGVSLPPDREQELLRLRKLRNRLGHFPAATPSQAAKAAAARALSVVMQFIDEELAPLNARDAALQADILDALTALDGYVAHRWGEIRTRVEDAEGTVIVCPRCQQKSAQLANGITCHFCGYQASAEDAAASYVADVLGVNDDNLSREGGMCPRYRCSQCDADTLVNIFEGFVCFTCGAAYALGELTLCAECGQPFSSRCGQAEATICDDCAAKDDGE